MTIGIILAAGSGTRFGETSKLFIDLCGQRVIDYPINLCKELDFKSINIVLKDKSMFSEIETSNLQAKIHLHEQTHKGTGGAVKSVICEESNDDIVVLLGDCPLVEKEDIKKALNKLNEYELVIGGLKSEGPHSYGRIIFEKNKMISIEEKNIHQNETKFRNAGWMVCKGQNFHKILNNIPIINHEYYLTECIRIANKMGFSTGMIETNNDIGINTTEDYVKAVESLQDKFRMHALKNGAIMIDPKSTFLSCNTIIEESVILNPNITIKGNVKIKKGSEIKSFSHIEDSIIGENCVVGPFANMRSGTTLENNVNIGCFVETKNSLFSRSSKAKHLSYIGDASIGKETNIGAGVIFCNYDGKQKNKSTVGDNSFLGANSSYVAPIEIGNNVKVGAGSVVTKNIESNCLSVSRAEQKEFRRKV